MIGGPQTFPGQPCSHRVYVGRAEIEAACSKRSNKGRDHVSLKLDDASFNAPIFANLFDDENGEGFTLIRSRRNKRISDQTGQPAMPRPSPGPFVRNAASISLHWFGRDDGLLITIFDGIISLY